MLAIPGVGFNLGLDFTGGYVIRVTVADQAELQEARKEVAKIVESHNLRTQFMNEQGVGGQLAFTVRYQNVRGLDTDEMIVFNNALKAEIEALKTADKFGGIMVADADNISASASAERLLSTFIAIAVSLIAILIYMLFRFRFTSGVAALVGLVHDFLMLAALCIIFRVQINYSFIAAAITVIVYSLNNTIVLFDRIRGKEKMNEQKLKTEQIVDASVKETFGRTISTTLTTLVPVIALCCIGVPLIREFALPILFGLIAGTFSTIFVTTGLYVRFESARRIARREKLNKQENLVTVDK
jgi:preprotein translocase SecF subunit